MRVRRASAAQSLTNTRQRARSVCSVTDPTPAVQAHARRQWRASASALEARACVGGARVRASTARVHMCVSSTAALACVCGTFTHGCPSHKMGSASSTPSAARTALITSLFSPVSVKGCRRSPRKMAMSVSVRLQAQMIMSAAARPNQRVVAMISPHTFDESSCRRRLFAALPVQIRLQFRPVESGKGRDGFAVLEFFEAQV